MKRFNGCNHEQNLFWNMLSDEIDNNGNPFSLTTVRNYYAHIDEGNYGCKLIAEFVLTKRICRVGIYIVDDTETNYLSRLLPYKDEINEKLDCSVVWHDGVRNPNAKRIESEFPFVPYDSDDYSRVIDEILPVIAKYKDVFSVYLPEAFRR